MLTVLVALFAGLSLFNTIFIVFLVAGPREFHDSNGNLDMYKVFWYALAAFLVVALIYAAIVLLTRLTWRANVFVANKEGEGGITHSARSTQI